MADIIVAGAGHGGVVAAMLLSRVGHNVTVYEKQKREETGLEQHDSFDASAFDYAGIEIPDSFRAPANIITLVPLGDDVESITLPAPENYSNLTADRRELIAYLIGLAEEAGVRFEFGCEIKGPIMLGGRVSGIVTGNGEHYADLVIDSAGVHSPVRNGLPAFLYTDKDPEYYDILHAYRAYFGRIPGVPDPENLYNIYVKEDGTEGFRWAVTGSDYVDVLLVRFPEITYPDVAQGLLAVSEMNPHMDRDISRGGHFADIPVRQPAAVMVADGYAAIGDSAFMTYAVKGSGIAYSIKAGKILADAVELDKDGLFSAETLWEYEKRFYKEIGFSACRLAVIKAIMPYLTAAEINEVFKKGLLTTEELFDLVAGIIPKTKLVSEVREKLKILGDVPEFKSHITTMLGWLGKFTILEPFFPEKYSRESIAKWSQRYNKFFDSIRKREETEESE